MKQKKLQQLIQKIIKDMRGCVLLRDMLGGGGDRVMLVIITTLVTCNQTNSSDVHSNTLSACCNMLILQC